MNFDNAARLNKYIHVFLTRTHTEEMSSKLEPVKLSPVSIPEIELRVMEVSYFLGGHRGTPVHHPFQWDFPMIFHAHQPATVIPP